MKITQESTGKLTACIKIELAKEDYEPQVEKVLKDHKKKAVVPGFRPGHVPYGLIKKQYGTAVLYDEINKIISDSLNNYIEENKIELLGNPIPNTEKSPKPESLEQDVFEFHFDIAIRPEINLVLDENISVDFYQIQVGEEEVNKEIASIILRNGENIHTEISEKQDSLSGNLVELNDNGEPKEGGINKNTSVIIEQIHHDEGQKRFIGLSKDAIVDFLPSETFAHEHEYTSVLGIGKEKADESKSMFRFQVENVNRMLPAVMNDEFFAKFYPAGDVKSEEELREKLRSEISLAYQKECERKFMHDTVDKLIELADIQLPDDFMKRWLLETNSDKITKETVDEQYEQSKNALKWQLLENKIVTENNIYVSEEDVKKFIKESIRISYFSHLEADSPMLDTIVESVMKNKEEVKNTYDRMYDERLTELFSNTLNKNIKIVTLDEFVKIISEHKHFHGAESHDEHHHD